MKLCQILAQEKGYKTRANEARDIIYKNLQKANRYKGLNRTWHKLDDDGEDFPDESKKAQARAEDDLQALREAVVPWYDAVATKDLSNCSAKANVTIEGKTILSDVPVTTLLFLEKELVHMRTILQSSQTLDETKDWTQDAGTGFYKTDAEVSGRTKKVQKAIVLYDATPEHPAQTQLISEDVLIGHWKTVNISGALTRRQQEGMLKRVEQLITAVRLAREEANTAKATPAAVGASLFDFIFS